MVSIQEMVQARVVSSHVQATRLLVSTIDSSLLARATWLFLDGRSLAVRVLSARLAGVVSASRSQEPVGAGPGGARNGGAGRAVLTEALVEAMNP